MRYRAEIDGLRALAVVPVILFHAGLPAFGGGFVGVDVFFVISGYLITGILLRELAEERFSILGFYDRRARRILPALFFVILVCLPFAYAWMMPRDLTIFSQSLAAVALFASNILFWQTSGYFDTASELKPLLHTWSLAVEEQFYIFFPLLLAAAWRFGRRAVLAILAGLFVASLALAEATSHSDPAAAFFLLPMRGWELLIGAFAAFRLERRDAPDATPLAQGAGLAGLALIAGAVALYDEHTPFPGVYALAPTLGAVLIILFAVPGTLVHRLLGTRVLVGIGLVSYSAYLWHQPIFAFARYRAAGPIPDAAMLGLCALTLPLAILTWRFVERPFRQRGRVGRGAIFAGSGALIALVFGLGLAGHLSHGLPQRLGEVRSLAAASAVSSPMRRECHTGGAAYRSPAEACRYFSEHPTWAVFGDSHGVELAYGMAEALRSRGDGIVHLTFTACPPRFGDSDGSPCADWTRDAVAAITADPGIANVVVTYRIGSALFGGHEGLYPGFPEGNTDLGRARSWAAYTNVLAEFVRTGKRVYLVLQAPEVRTDVAFLIARMDESRPAPDVEGVPRAWWETRLRYVYDRLDQIPPGVTVIDPARSFCDETSCYAVRDGQALYFDDDHMSVHGAGIIAERILRDFDRPALVAGR